jgi:hypothetical protein
VQQLVGEVANAEGDDTGGAGGHRTADKAAAGSSRSCRGRPRWARELADLRIFLDVAGQLGPIVGQPGLLSVA